MRALGQEIPDLLHLRLEHSLHALCLTFKLSVKRLTLLLDLLLHQRKLLTTMIGKFRELPLQRLVLQHEFLNLTLQSGESVRHVITLH